MGKNCTKEQVGLQSQGAGLHFSFIRVEVMLKTADSAFKYGLRMPCILGTENAFDATEPLAFTSAQKGIHF